MKVTARSHSYADNAGDPLDGLVNLFDLGIVLAVAFLLAALSSLDLTQSLTEHGLKQPAPDEIVVKPGDKVAEVPPGGATTVGKGTEVGKVYRLDDGRLIYVTGGPE